MFRASASSCSRLRLVTAADEDRSTSSSAAYRADRPARLSGQRLKRTGCRVQQACSTVCRTMLWPARLRSVTCRSAPETYLTIFNCGGYRRGVRSSLVPVRKPSTRPGWYCMRRSRVLARAVSWARSRLARLARDRLQVGPDRLDRVELGGVGRELEDRQPVPGRDQLAHRLADVRVQVVPDQDERARRAAGARRPGAGRSRSR